MLYPRHRHGQEDDREGVTPALGDHQACTVLNAPFEETLKGKSDRAILRTLLFHAIRREELCRLKVGDVQQRQGVPYLRIEGKEISCGMSRPPPPPGGQPDVQGAVWSERRA